MENQEQSPTLLDEAEDRLQAAVRTGDLTALEFLLDDGVLYTGPDGRQLTKAEDLHAYASGALRIDVFEQQRRTTRVTGTTGLTWVLADLRGRAGGQPFAVRMHYTRTWAYDGAWRVVAAHASLVSD